MSKPERYPSPGDQGGRLLRELVSFLRKQGMTLPLGSHILIGVSGGADSLALLLLLARYGRRIVHPDQLVALHVNHGWRGEESAADARFVESICSTLGVRLIVRELDPSYLQERGDSLEERSRTLRKEIFSQECSRLGDGTTVWTAHQSDDLAETLLWRLFSGAAETHGAGILFQSGIEIRPLLFARRAELESFLKEEGQAWLADPSNEDPRFLRASMRKALMPRIEAIFPRAVEHLTQLGLRNQDLLRPGLDTAGTTGGDGKGDVQAQLAEVFPRLGLRIRRGNWREIDKILQSEQPQVSVDLPGGWSLKRIKKRVQKGMEDLTERRSVTKLKTSSRGWSREQWILERVIESSRS